MKVIQLPVSELKSALAGFNKIISSRTTLPALGCVRVAPQPEGVHLQVTDLDSFATCRIHTGAPADFPPCLISVAALAKVVKTSKDSVAPIHEGADRFKVRHFIGSTPVEQSIESLETKEWPPLPEFKAKPFLVEPGFKESFRHAMECASTESNHGTAPNTGIALPFQCEHPWPGVGEFGR
jgi:hypothetical protein